MQKRALTPVERQNLIKKFASINRQSERETYKKITAAGAGVGFSIGLGLGITAALTTFIPSFGLSLLAIPLFALAGTVIGGTYGLTAAGLLKFGSEWLSKRLSKRQNNVQKSKKNVRLVSTATIEDYFSCTTSQEIMNEPVILPGQGAAYEKSQIETFWKNRNRVDPVTNQPVADDYNLLPDRTLKQIITDYNGLKEKSTFKFFSKKAKANIKVPVPAGQFPMRALKPRLKCPITGKIMTDPVVASDGYTYERSAITRIIDRGIRIDPITKKEEENVNIYGVSPTTGQPLATPHLIDNTYIKALLKHYQQSDKKPEVVKRTDETLLPPVANLGM